MTPNVVELTRDYFESMNRDWDLDALAASHATTTTFATVAFCPAACGGGLRSR